MSNFLNTLKQNKIDVFLITIAGIIGFTSLFIPVWWLLLSTLLLLIIIWGIFHPKYIYYSLILTIPFAERIRVLPISFSINDLIILWCTFAVCLNIFFNDEREINFKTKLDKWIIVLLIIFFFSGMTSLGPTGYLSFFKYLEAVLTYYMTVYFIRTKKVKVTKILKFIILSGLFQASYGIIQSLTGSFGANFHSPRNILGYLGIGPTTVWHAIGTLGHSNILGNYLITVFLFMLPFKKYFWRNKKLFLQIVSIFLIGIYMTYSRGSWMSLFFGFIFYTYLTLESKFIFNTLLMSLSGMVWAAYLFLKDTSYVQTLSPREAYWGPVFAFITSSPHYFWFGAGLNSFQQTVWAYENQNDPTRYFAHNYFLLCWQETGLIGMLIIIAFFMYICINSVGYYKKSHGFSKAIHLSIGIIVFLIFFMSIFDHVYSTTFLKILLYLCLGIGYAKIDEKFNLLNGD